MEQVQDKKVYRVQGFTCASCAAQFEENVKKLPGVRDAKVNFGASKITVYGNPSIQDLEKAGAFENLKIYPENKEVRMEREPFWKRRETIQVGVSLVFLIVGWLMGESYGEKSIPSVVSYLLSMLIGGYALFRKGLLKSNTTTI